ncbi:HAMP domain-containing sensor histidine kinase [Marinobacterium stanieri]|uniref:histidine kinase n=1 Tax=Marinobacterium stanieri TaxID=49186 RepID=A0A1N6R0E3_9GAMM|nr:histidine kinase [Marinobacterium stanieri]SIQ22259.1 two-component system, NarL family, sensor histidine kinase UhpB [Marinobacterium stanieri]
MKAVVRLNLLVASAFMLALLISLFGLMRQAKTDILRELQAGMAVADQLLEQVAQDPERLEPLLAIEWRHMHLAVLSAGQSPVPLEMDEVPEWFASWIWPQDMPSIERRRPLADGRTLVVMADPADEMEEVWESALQVFALFMGGAALSILAISWGLSQGMRPFGQVLRALDQIQQGHFTARLKSYSVPEANRLASHFNRMAEALEQEQADNRRLTRELMVLQEKERSYLARELHDDLGQYLTGIRAQAYLISQVSGDAEKVSKSAPLIVRDCEAMQQGFRRLIRSLHPVILEPLGLEDSLRSLAEQWQRSSGVDCRLGISGMPLLSDETSTHLYRLLQEALNNVARHAQASLVEIGMQVRGDTLNVRVEDNGQGLSADVRPGIGLRSMHERARYMNADLHLLSAAGGGLRIELSLPLVMD